MKLLKQILFAIAVAMCFSITASAQKQDDKKPKDPKPPVIIVVPKGDEKPKGNEKPKDNDKPKKPQSAYLKTTNNDEMIFV